MELGYLDLWVDTELDLPPFWEPLSHTQRTHDQADELGFIDDNDFIMLPDASSLGQGGEAQPEGDVEHTWMLEQEQVQEQGQTSPADAAGPTECGPPPPPPPLPPIPSPPSVTARFHVADRLRTAVAAAAPSSFRHRLGKRAGLVESSDRALRRTAHNVIEKRYRGNLNDKLAALRDCLPKLRVRAIEQRSGDAHGRRDNSNTSTKNNSSSVDTASLRAPSSSRSTRSPTIKLAKAEVLTSAIEYIKHLEVRLRVMAAENAALRARIVATHQESGSQRHRVVEPAGAVAAAATTAAPGAGDGAVGAASPDGMLQQAQAQALVPPAPLSSEVTTSMKRPGSPQGMIKVPEDIQRLRLSPCNADFVGHFAITPAPGLVQHKPRRGRGRGRRRGQGLSTDQTGMQMADDNDNDNNDDEDDDDTIDDNIGPAPRIMVGSLAGLF
jgi:hypothetical protein